MNCPEDRRNFQARVHGDGGGTARSNVAVLKTVDPYRIRGFESHPHRQKARVSPIGEAQWNTRGWIPYCTSGFSLISPGGFGSIISERMDDAERCWSWLNRAAC